MRTRTRRQHTKSRGGCVECKRRHTKCDERRPVCSQCDKRSIRCQYVMKIIDANSPVQSPASASAASPATTEKDSNSLLEINTLHAELLLHWSRHLVSTLGWNDEVVAAWIEIFNREPLNHPFLMKGMLAMSACHISRTDESKYHYINYAVELFGAAITEFLPHLETVNDNNFIAAFAFSGIIQSMQMSLPPLSGDTGSQSLLESFLQHIPTSRGSVWLVRTMFEPIKKSELRPIVEIGPVPTTHPNGFLEAHSQLKDLNSQHCGQDEIYKQVIDQLPDLFARSTVQSDTSYLPSMWGVFVPNEYPALVRRREPMAMVILAYAAVLYYYSRHKWFFEGIGAQLALIAYDSLDESWRPAIQWPMNEIGLNQEKQHPETPGHISME
ncbi:hypothetical protein BS50DRAFT_681854 [Corynespora cassiicola Philippines]|uniref:Zn(2)-C6 fungal-type domain-containing protein n=1 Tax=Corynespora cassiicola Philippines TaxID=1448308 RepID=A0A2T2N3K5_CORCC|nr:hypothetical protein BS50DRAFT_681854 [Corynespora cassiicola Philippines]